MAVCPKCGRKLKMTELKPECPGCGVNLLYYKIEERLEVDAINAELEHAKTQQRIDRAKASMVGSALTIIRLVLLVLTVGMLFLPLANLHIQGPYFERNTAINAIEVYNGVSSMDFDALFTMIGSPVLGKSFTFFTVAMVMIVVTVLCALLELILSFLSCSPKGFARNMIFAVLGIASTITSMICYNKFISGISGVLPGLVSGAIGVGAYLVIAAFALVAAINIVIKVKGVNIKYKQSYVDDVPYEKFIELFGDGWYDYEKVDSIRDEIAKHRVTEETA